jgi:hypothetical protein
MHERTHLETLLNALDASPRATPRQPAMSDDIKKITIQIRRPRSKDVGEVAIATTASSRVSFILTGRPTCPPALTSVISARTAILT